MAERVAVYDAVAQRPSAALALQHNGEELGRGYEIADHDADVPNRRRVMCPMASYSSPRRVSRRWRSTSER